MHKYLGFVTEPMAQESFCDVLVLAGGWGLHRPRRC
jgi:hypothetical protein